ncbi:MAG: transcriptional regulator [Ignavibacteria bacterium]|nr:transcriptional regulator [Ignavibacteria bacterium]MBK9406023.1 transcriptional regulator [Ignavibacteria bacterium]
MRIKPIRTKKDHERALKRIDDLWGCKKNSPEGDEFEILLTLTEKYEDEHYPIPPPDPLEAIKFRLDQMNLTRSELVKFIGYKSRVSEILTGKRKLTLPMIRTLNKKLRIPAEILIKKY